MKIQKLGKPAGLLWLLLQGFASFAQNVGIGTASPQNRLHVLGNSSLVLRVESLTDVGSEIVFETPSGNKGYIGSYNNAMEITSLGASPVVLSTNGVQRMVISSAGNVGIATNLLPQERLTIQSGNLLLSNSDKGVILNAADRPFITRGFDAFTSGNYLGLGRWGMFMEPNRLTLGVPNTGGKGWEFAQYDANSSKTAVLNIDANNGAISRPAQGSADLLPVCMGYVQSNGGIVSGTGNFTVFKDIGAGITEITVTNELITDNGYIIVVTPVKLSISTSTGFAMTEVISFGKFRVWTYTAGGTVTNLPFRFVVYRIA